VQASFQGSKKFSLKSAATPSCNSHALAALAFAMAKNLLSEGLGSLLLLATVVGSGIMGESLSGGNVAIALLANALATGAMLFVLISVFGPVSGAHFNPLVTVAMAVTRRMAWAQVPAYVAAQVAGAILGVLLAHMMFDQNLIQVSQKLRWGHGQWWSEAVASFGLLLTILALLHHKSSAIAQAVALYIVGAYWFTASTSFANPAVTLARMFTDSFAGIAPSSVIGFVLAQILGMALALACSALLFAGKKS
jgi:glycerol uptake facilitator-like aquaporin